MKFRNFWLLYTTFIVFATLAGSGFFAGLNTAFNLNLNQVWVNRVGYVISVILYLSTGRNLSIAWWKLFLILVVSAIFKRWVYENFPSLGFAIPYLFWEYTLLKQRSRPTQTQ